MTKPINSTPSEKVHDLAKQENLLGSTSPLSAVVIPSDQDAYCTPTVEDYILHERQSQQGRHQGQRSNNISNIQLPLPGLLAQELHPSNVILEIPPPGRMGWRARVRHFTWTFFSMTMATGGIANVLSTGK